MDRTKRGRDGEIRWIIFAGELIALSTFDVRMNISDGE